MDDSLQTNGAFLRDLRIAHGERQVDLAKVLHVSRQLLSMWECDKARVGMEFLIQIAEHYQMDLKSVTLGYYNQDIDHGGSEQDQKNAIASVAERKQCGVRLSPVVKTGLITAFVIVILYLLLFTVILAVLQSIPKENFTENTIIVIRYSVLIPILLSFLCVMTALTMAVHKVVLVVRRARSVEEDPEAEACDTGSAELDVGTAAISREDGIVDR